VCRFILGVMASMWQTHLRKLTSGLDPSTRGKLDFRALIARAPMIASVVLGFAIAAQAAAIAVSLSAQVGVGFGARSAAMIGPRAHARRGMGFEDITAAHLFGVAPQAMTATNTRAVSRSPLVLTGIIATSDPRVGFAIVGGSASSARTICVGSEAAPGTVLAEVYPQWVVLLRGGERLTLRLPRKDLPGYAGAGVSRALAREESAPVADDDGESSGAVRAYLPPPPISDGAAVVRAFQLRPTMIDGQKGERIADTSLNHKVLDALNLSPGDVIVQVNGVPVGASNAPNLMSALQSGNATLLVVKDGQETSVTLDANSMADAAALFRQVDPDL
jgi:type II secretory pathway component PulC